MKDNYQDSRGVVSGVGYKQLTTPHWEPFKGQNILMIAKYFVKNYFFCILNIKYNFW